MLFQASLLLLGARPILLSFLRGIVDPLPLILGERGINVVLTFLVFLRTSIPRFEKQYSAQQDQE